jgi:DNA-directed RNA polymerase sigma subunit (sigma70/sigma32)
MSNSRRLLKVLQANQEHVQKIAPKSFVDEIHAIDRISREDEINLSQAIQESLRLRASMSVKSTRSPTFENLAADLDMDDGEARAVFMAGLKARHILVTANLRLVQRAVNKVMRSRRADSQVNSADLMQEGILGLIRAAEKFDSTKGFAFSTYATIWIQSNISHSLKHDASIIRVPQQAALMKRRVDAYRIAFKSKFGDLAEPSVAEMAKAFGVTEEQVLTVLRRPVIANFASSSTFEGGGENMVHHMLADKELDSGGVSVVERALVAETLLDQLRRVLSATEWEALVLRYGLLPEHKGRILTYPEVAKIMNRTQAQSRHAVKTSVKKLQTPALRAMLQPFLESF